MTCPPESHVVRQITRRGGVGGPVVERQQPHAAVLIVGFALRAEVVPRPRRDRLRVSALARRGPRPLAQRVRRESGRFDDVLPGVLSEMGSVDYVFIDGHHEEEATNRYFELVRPYLSDIAVVVFDDIR
ncbi:MAG TPA: class I SAM-dependent methyltransferase [Steroidobacter sp.]